jgi:DNA-3-methyladenine glycosylase II
MKQTEAQMAWKFLQTADPILAKVIEKVGVLDESKSTNYFISLIESIVSQQLSVKVADVIYARFENLFPAKVITPEKVLEIDTEAMRGVGMSYGKVKYVKSLAEHVIASPTMFETFDEMNDEDIISELIQIKGIGQWTAEMFLIFTMGRPDVFSYGDLGLKNAIRNLYGLLDRPTIDVATDITDAWRPYRSYGSRYLWKSLELK